MLSGGCNIFTAGLYLCQIKFNNDEPIIHKCPLGFELSPTISGGDSICYRRKGPEYFEDVYEDCIGNLFTSKLYHDLNLTEPEHSIWTEYKSYYPGGLFIDTSHTKTFGEELILTNITIDHNLDIDEEWCIVIDPVTNFTAVKCNEKHYRYCFVKPYPDVDDMSYEGCNDLKDSFRIRSPQSTCLTALYDFNALNTTYIKSKGMAWNARKFCSDRGGSLLYRGWRYANSPILKNKMIHPSLIISVPRSEENKYIRKLIGYTKYNVDPPFETTISDIACEHHVPLRHPSMNISIDKNINQLIMSVNETIDEDDIMCYTRASKGIPMKVSKKRKENNIFILNESNNGYYWCTHKDIMNFAPAESNKVLYIKNTGSLKNVYVIKFRLKYRIEYDQTDLFNWLQYYLHDMVQYERVKIEGTDRYETLVIMMMIVKRLYLDLKTIVAHVSFNISLSLTDLTMLSARFRQIRDPLATYLLKILSLKPVYYCARFDSVPDTPLGQVVDSTGCQTHTCVGDFDEGVQWVTTPTVNCTTLENDTKTNKPHEAQVLRDLDRLVNNESDIFVDDIADVVEQVNEILEMPDDLKKPAKLLHLLDQLGSKVVLNETGLGSVIQPNIALLMANAQRNNTVRGFRVARVPADNAYQFITENPNLSELNFDDNDMVVILPQSVRELERRISFVVFRNDRAFHAESRYTVNSRVVSVKIGNVTRFTRGEVLNIYLRPIVTERKRNESRSCAYWHFLDNGTGYWSEEGCTFTRATEQGMMDTCSCNHLTHFAEVLIPRAVFSEANENALEIITIIGCFLSVVGLLIIGVTALLFRSWRRQYSNKIWLQLCIAIFFLVLSFLFITLIPFDYNDVKTCWLIGVALHYSVLASFCWMLVAAILAYKRLVLVYSNDGSHKLLKAAAFSWGAPCVIIGILCLSVSSSYARRFEEMMPSGSFCYPSGLGFWLTVFTPIASVLLINVLLFALIFYSVFVSNRVQRHGETNDALRCASVTCILVFLFGLPWIFGLFASNVVAAYLFTLTATFQGFILFVLFVPCNKNTRDLWLNKLRMNLISRVPLYE